MRTVRVRPCSSTRNAREFARPAILATLFLVCIGGASLAQHAASSTAGGAQTGSVAHTSFVPNGGQWNEGARYLARRGAESYWLTNLGWIAAVHATEDRDIVIQTTFEGATPRDITGEERQPGHHNFLLGNDRERWVTGLTSYGTVRWYDLYAGIDGAAHVSNEGFTYDFVVAPDADANTIVMHFAGADRIEIGNQGALELHTELGFLAHSAPKAWEVESDGSRFPIAVCFRRVSEDRMGFDVERRTRGRSLHIDPGLTWSLVMGGGGVDRDNVQDLYARDGYVWAAIESRSATFPTTPGVVSVVNNGSSDCVVQFRDGVSNGLIYSTYLGGSSDETPYGMTVSANFEVVLVGTTSSSDYPTTSGAFQPTFGGFADAFITQLDVVGTQLNFSSYLGGSDSDELRDVTQAPNGEWWFAGSTTSTNFPTAGPMANTLVGTRDAVVGRSSADATQLMDSFHLGGSDTDRAHSIAVNANNGGPAIGMVTRSTNFPVTANAFQANNAGSFDFAITVLDATWSSMTLSTYHGGSGTEQLARSSEDGTCFAGHSYSADFPTTPGAIQTINNSSFSNAVLFVIDPQVGLTQSTYWGGPDSIIVRDMRANASGIALASVVLSGTTPTTPGAYQTSFGGGTFDTHVVRFDRALTKVNYASYLGGSLDDQAWAVAIAENGSIYVGGETNSANFPGSGGTTSGFDAFISRFDGLPTGVTRYGSNSSAFGSPTAFLGVSGMPTPTNTSFAATAWGAPSSGIGAVVLSLAPDVAGTLVPGFGVISHVDLNVAVSFAAFSNASGVSEVLINLANTLAGYNYFMQSVWVDPATSLLAASDAIDFVVQ